MDRNYANHERTVTACDGTCCRKIMIPREGYALLMRKPGKIVDGEMLQSMLRVSGTAWRDGVEYVVFDCRNLDDATGRCTIYDRRPGMCRSYPNSKLCEWCGSSGFISRRVGQ